MKIGSSRVHTMDLTEASTTSKLAKTVGSKELKENLPRNKQTVQELSASGSMLLPRQPQTKR